MAKCPTCGKIWHCRGEGLEYAVDFDEELEHCRICRCDKCREKDAR